MIDSRDINELAPVLKRAASELLSRAKKAGVNILITSTYRDIEKQNALYAQGRTAPGSIVTNCRGGDSYHNWRAAFDFVPLNSSGSAIWDSSSPNWATVGKIGMEMGMTWGGSWTGFVDKPHFEYTAGLKIADFKAGKKIPDDAILPWEKTTANQPVKEEAPKEAEKTAPPAVVAKEPQPEIKEEPINTTPDKSLGGGIIKGRNEIGVFGKRDIDVGKIRVTPFEFESILEIRIEKELNKHSTLYVCGIISDVDQFTPVTSITEGASINCEHDGLFYFKGVLEDIKITRENDVYRLEVYAISNTILLDTIKYKRSFQDNDQTYQAIVETVIAENDGAVSYYAAEMTVEHIILQYNETDWEFAKRLASHTQDVLIPITADNPAFHFGVPDEGEANLAPPNFSISKDFDLFRRMVSQADPLTVDDVTVYTVETDYLACDLGEKFNLNGIDLHVRRLSLSFINSSLSVVYTLCGEKAVSAPKSYNRAITGLVLDGKVLKVENDNVKLHLYIDEEQDEGTAHLFVYATGYSMEGHTGWYVMPEEGDTVQLLFPGEDEKDAYAVSSVRRDDTERVADPLVKFWRTSFGKEIKMDEKEILISSVDDKTFIRINMDTGIHIITPKPIKIDSGDTIDIMSEKDMTISTGENLAIAAIESIVLNCGENTITIAPPSGITAHTDQMIDMSSEGDTMIHSDNMIDLSSNNDLTITAQEKLLLLALLSLKLIGSGSSIMLAGVINMVASLIKQK
jgi:hypothetical protein